ncbi:MAG: hypothetical protein V2I24_11455 [Halieaceae bacterium]|nr:hypothetical protein [Halieaceae bacterium]
MEPSIISVCTPERTGDRAAWVVERCGGPLFTVNRWVPAGFERYIQICPPAWRMPTNRREYEFSPSDRDPRYPCNLTPVPWATVAAARGHAIGLHTCFHDLTPHTEMQSAQPGDYLGPLEETPTGAMIDAVGEAVLSFSGAGQECLVAVWSGFGSREIDQLHARKAAMITGMGQQEHFLLSADVATVIGTWRSLLPDQPVSASSVASRSPQAIWPATREWFYAVPFDWHSSFFAGPASLATTLLKDERIESYPVALDADYRRGRRPDCFIGP